MKEFVKNRTILLTAAFSLFLLSCQKEIAPEEGHNSEKTVTDVRGSWKFVNFRKKTMVTYEVIAAGDTLKTVTINVYTSENNGGIFIFGEHNMQYDSLSYSINTLTHSTMYKNNVLVNSNTVPVSLLVRPTTGEAFFTKVGSDSLHFPNGSFISTGTPQPAKLDGAKIQTEQDKLYLIQKGRETNSSTDRGQIVASTRQVEIVITFQKQ